MPSCQLSFNEIAGSLKDSLLKLPVAFPAECELVLPHRQVKRSEIILKNQYLLSERTRQDREEDKRGKHLSKDCNKPGLGRWCLYGEECCFK